METNANSRVLAALLQDARLGTFTGLITRKKGEVKGGVQYGDDLVHAVIFTGFRYTRLVERSLEGLATISNAGIVAKAASKGLTDKTGRAIVEADVEIARIELEASFQATLAGVNAATTDHVYDPLTVDGETVRGGRVYHCVKEQGITCHCRECTGDKKAPLHGTIYLQGLRVYSKVLEAAPNGPVPPAKSAAKTVAKDLLRGALPISKYVSYALEPGTDFLLKVGGSAAVEAVGNGFVVNDDVVELLQRAA